MPSCLIENVFLLDLLVKDWMPMCSHFTPKGGDNFEVAGYNMLCQLILRLKWHVWACCCLELCWALVWSAVVLNMIVSHHLAAMVNAKKEVFVDHVLHKHCWSLMISKQGPSLKTLTVFGFVHAPPLAEDDEAFLGARGHCGCRRSNMAQGRAFILEQQCQMIQKFLCDCWCFWTKELVENIASFEWICQFATKEIMPHPQPAMGAVGQVEINQKTVQVSSFKSSHEIFPVFGFTQWMTGNFLLSLFCFFSFCSKFWAHQLVCRK